MFSSLKSKSFLKNINPKSVSQKSLQRDKQELIPIEIGLKIAECGPIETSGRMGLINHTYHLFLFGAKSPFKDIFYALRYCSKSQHEKIKNDADLFKMFSLAFNSKLSWGYSEAQHVVSQAFLIHAVNLGFAYDISSHDYNPPYINSFNAMKRVFFLSESQNYIFINLGKLSKEQLEEIANLYNNHYKLHCNIEIKNRNKDNLAHTQSLLLSTQAIYFLEHVPFLLFKKDLFCKYVLKDFICHRYGFPEKSSLPLGKNKKYLR